jgi:hypothetical protein
MPRDGGNLIVEAEEYAEVMADPVAAKYVRPFLGSRELMNNKQRWCLWLTDLDPADVSRSTVLRERLSAVRAFREKSSASSTRAMAATPHLFGQRSQPSTAFLCMPRVVSENRPYFTVQLCSEDVIASDAVFHAQDPKGLLFSLASSSMFITWQKTIGGRLKSDIRFASTLTWNTFPVPDLADDDQKKIIAAGHKVIAARAKHPDRSLADHYNPLAMDPVLVRAHGDLDREVDRVFGASRKLSNERQRLELLFARYAELAQ